MAKKGDQPGNFMFRHKNDDDPYIQLFFEAQSNKVEAIRILVAQEVERNGIRDLAEYYPARRKPIRPPVESGTEVDGSDRTLRNVDSSAKQNSISKISSIPKYNLVASSKSNALANNILSAPQKEKKQMGDGVYQQNETTDTDSPSFVSTDSEEDVESEDIAKMIEGWK